MILGLARVNTAEAALAQPPAPGAIASGAATNAAAESTDRYRIQGANNAQAVGADQDWMGNEDGFWPWRQGAGNPKSYWLEAKGGINGWNG